MSNLALLAHSFRLEVFGQLLLAILLGGAIGLERELQGKPAGLRTNIMICMGATLFTLLSYRLAPPNGDVGRVAAQIVSGIGFLGAGTILHARGTVIGLTSAATIWLVAAIGMALGSHSYVEALGATALAMVVLDGLGFVEARIATRSSRTHLSIRVRPEPGSLEQVEAILKESGLTLEAWHILRQDDEMAIDVDVVGPRRLHEAARIALLEKTCVLSMSSAGSGSR